MLFNIIFTYILFLLIIKTTDDRFFIDNCVDNPENIC